MFIPTCNPAQVSSGATQSDETGSTAAMMEIDSMSSQVCHINVIHVPTCVLSQHCELAG